MSSPVMSDFVQATGILQRAEDVPGNGVFGILETKPMGFKFVRIASEFVLEEFWGTMMFRSAFA